MIDYEAVAAAFRDQFAVQTRGWPTLFDRMETLVDRLAEQAGTAERATRAYPVLRYRDGAVGVRLAPGPTALLGDVDGTGRSLGEGLSEGAHRFVAGFGWVEDAVTQELALPRLFSVAAGMVSAVDASLARFDKATPSMFDDRARTFSDIIGIAGLGWRALLGEQNQDQLLWAAFRFGVAADFFGSLFSAPDGTGGGDTASAASGFERLVATLEETAGLTMGALLLLPAASLTLDLLLEDGVLALKAIMLGEFSAIEESVYGLRGAIVDAWLAAFDVGTTLHHLTSAADFLVTVNTGLFAGAIPLWLDELLDGVEGMLGGVQAWASWTSAIIGAFRVAEADLMAVDLGQWVVRNTLGDWVADNVPVPTVTIGGIVELVAGQGSSDLRDDLDDFFGKVDKLLWAGSVAYDVLKPLPLPGRPPARQPVDDLRARVAALRTVFNLTLSPTPFTYPPDVLPTGPLAGFPDVYTAVFGGTRRADLLDAVRQAGTELQASMHELGTAGAGLAAGLARTAEDELRRQAVAGAGLQLGDRWRSEGALVGGLVQPLRDDLVARAAGAPSDPLAEAFEQAAGAGGIVAAAQAVPAYVGQLRSYWETRSQQREHPTSAHLLARRGRLAMVRVPRLTLTAHDRIPGEALASETADRFHDVVLGAYREGRGRMAVLARPAGEPAPAARVGGGGRRGR